MTLPFPPESLIRRVGSLPTNDLHGSYDRLGAAVLAGINYALPEDWDWAGQSVLDFGCGAGRTLRHLVDQAATASIYGADLDRRSIEWARANLSPPFQFVLTEESPPVDVPSDTFDLIFAISVFSHLTDHWAAWLVELHRILKPGGVLLATFMSEGMWQHNRPTGDEWDADKVGMFVSGQGRDWDDGGPTVLLSSWWLREHWGRLFEIERLEPRGFGGGNDLGIHDHGYALLRKTSRVCTVDELRAIDWTHEGEQRALLYSLQETQREAAALREASANIANQVGGRDAMRAIGAAIKRRLHR